MTSYTKTMMEALAEVRGIKKEAYELGTDEYREYLEKLTPGEMDEASAKADAMRAMRRGKKEVDPADVDTDASDDDVKAADKNIMMQLRKSVSLRGKFKVEFGDKKKKEVPVRIAQEVQKKYNSLRRPADKEEFQAKIAKSYESMLKALKENAIKEKTSQDRIVGLVGDKLKEKKHG